MKKIILGFLSIILFEGTNASLENVVLKKLVQQKPKKTWPAIDSDNCDMLISLAEKKYNIPKGLLKAIAIRESFRRTSNKSSIWPWTVNVNGKGYFFNSKQEAIAKVIALKKRGLNVIDVGCMQINLYYHPNAFSNLNDAFTPAKNIDYAARLLCKLKKETGSWKTAVCYYHSKCHKYYAPYCAAVMKHYAQTSKEKIALPTPPRTINLVKMLSTMPNTNRFNNFKTQYYAKLDKKISERLQQLGNLTYKKDEANSL